MPEARVVTANDATPLVRFTVPRSVAPSRNRTVPVADRGITLAVKVTACPTMLGFEPGIAVTVAAVKTVIGVIGVEKLEKTGSPL